MDRPTKPSGRHAVRLRWDEIITRLSYRFNFLAIRDITTLALGSSKPPATPDDEAAPHEHKRGAGRRMSSPVAPTNRPLALLLPPNYGAMPRGPIQCQTLRSNPATGPRTRRDSSEKEETECEKQ